MKIERIIITCVICLSLFGLLMIYSSSYVWAEYKYGFSHKYLLSQSIFFIIGLFFLFLFSKINYKKYLKYSNIVIFISLFLLILVLIPGIGVERNGSMSWFGIGPFGIQPSEFAKIAIIIFIAKFISNNKNTKSFTKFLLPILIIIIIFFSLIMLEPDFGTGMIIVCSIISLLFVSGVKTNFFIKLGVLGVIGIIVLIITAPYRINRITSFLNPWKDELGSGFQIIQSLYAIGPGGVLGYGLFNSRQKQFYLPEPQTDFIFSIISEEFGFLGILIISVLFCILFYYLISISLKCNNYFGKYLSFGISFMLIFQTLLNLMVVVGLLPVTGVTLPFISYGGSSLIISMISIGIVLNINKDCK